MSFAQPVGLTSALEGTPMTTDEVRPFRIEIPTRTWTIFRTGSPAFDGPRAGWWRHGYGVPVARVHELVEFWRHRYDWRAWEARLNEHPPDLLVADLRNLFAGLR
jgi:hypothetical protein